MSGLQYHFSPKIETDCQPDTELFFESDFRMKYLLYAAAVLLIIFWAIGFFVYSIGAIVHLLLVLAGAAILFKTFQSEMVKRQNSSSSGEYSNS